MIRKVFPFLALISLFVGNNLVLYLTRLSVEAYRVIVVFPIVQAIFQLTFILALVVMLFKTEPSVFEVKKLGLKKTLFIVLVGVLSLGLSVWAYQFYEYVGSTSQGTTTAIVSLLSHKPLFVLALVQIIIFTPWLEELICRASFMTSYFRQSPYYLDILFSAGIFAGVHFLFVPWSWINFLFYLIPGLAYGLIFRYSQSIYYSLLAHGFHNLLANLYLIIWFVSYHNMI